MLRNAVILDRLTAKSHKASLRIKIYTTSPKISIAKKRNQRFSQNNRLRSPNKATVCAFSPKGRMAPPKFVLGTVVIVFALTRSIRSIVLIYSFLWRHRRPDIRAKCGAYRHFPAPLDSFHFPIESVGDGSPVPAGMAGTKRVHGADVIVTAFAARFVPFPR